VSEIILFLQRNAFRIINYKYKCRVNEGYGKKIEKRKTATVILS
jgi:hypothetical protein